MKYLTLFPLAIILTGCLGNGTQYIPEAFAPYVDEFFAEANARGLGLQLEDYTISAVFRELDTSERVAECDWSNQLQMAFDPDVWTRSDVFYRRYLVFHELGHCVLRRPHRSTRNDFNQCHSLMRGGDSERCLQNLWDEDWWKYYVDELFDPELLPDGFFPAVPYPAVLAADRTSYHATNTDPSALFDEFNEPVNGLATENFLIQFASDEVGDGAYVWFRIGQAGFGFCGGCTLKTASISSGEVRYSARLADLELPVTLAVYRSGQEVHFYVNEIYVHTWPAALLEADGPIYLRGRTPRDNGQTYSLEVDTW